MSDPSAFDPRQIQSLLDLGSDPDLVRELVDLLEADVPQRLEGLDGAFRAGDAARVVEEAHRLKGALGNMGFDRSADLARQVEDLARSGRMEAAALPAGALPEAYREGLAALRAAFPG